MTGKQNKEWNLAAELSTCLTFCAGRERICFGNEVDRPGRDTVLRFAESAPNRPEKTEEHAERRYVNCLHADG